MNLKKIVGSATVAGALSAAALGFGIAPAHADDDWLCPWCPDLGPGQVIPPGHWDKPEKWPHDLWVHGGQPWEWWH